jgi:hypothetical protein
MELNCYRLLLAVTLLGIAYGEGKSVNLVDI